MRRLVLAAALFISTSIAAGSIAAGLSGPLQAAEPKATVDLRNAVMWSIATHLNQIKGAVTTADVKTVAAHAAALKALAPHVPTMFPEGTGPDVIKSRAKAEIWTNWDGFVEASAKMQERAAALEVLAKEGADGPALVAGFAQLGKEGCGTCHKAFRAPKD